ncbi:MAG: hypothetical protein NTV34_01260, partial [Proteobacteria bacterium]|nr:hypothetical protein [Pseudomonadota bacterium]
MKFLKVLMIANLGMSTAIADRSGGGSGWLPEWPHEQTLFDNKHVNQLGHDKEVWFGECRSIKGAEHPDSQKTSIIALGVFPFYKRQGNVDPIHTKFYAYPIPISAKRFMKILSSQGDPNQGEELYPEVESLVGDVRSRYKSEFEFSLHDFKGKATLLDDGSWQWYEPYDHDSATFTLSSFTSAFSSSANERP